MAIVFVLRVCDFLYAQIRQSRLCRKEMSFLWAKAARGATLLKITRIRGIENVYENRESRCRVSMQRLRISSEGFNSAQKSPSKSESTIVISWSIRSAAGCVKLSGCRSSNPWERELRCRHPLAERRTADPLRVPFVKSGKPKGSNDHENE